MSSSGMHPHPESLYFHIAKGALEEAFSETDEFKIAQQIATSLVFSSLCLESFITQQYMKHEQTKKIIEDDDVIKLESKWLMLPLLLGQKNTFEKDRSPFQDFHSLVNTRNQRLVHFKPHKETRESDKDYSKPYFGELVKDVSYGKQCV